MKKYMFFALFAGLLTLIGCSKGGLDGVYENKFGSGETEASHKLIFNSGGTVEMTSAFGNDNLSGEYTLNGDTVTVTIDGGFNSEPTEFKISSDALIESDGTRWAKIN